MQASGSIIPSLNTYFTALCANSTPTCSNATITSAQSSIASGCASDISSGGTDAAEIDALGVLLKDYPEVYSGGCTKNSSTGDFCVTDTLNTFQSDTGTNVSVSFLTALLAGDTSTFQTALNSGNLCTGCVQSLYEQALRANASIANNTLGQAIQSKCGASFASSSATGISGGASASSSSASAATSSSASKSAGSAQAGVPQPLTLLPIAVAALSMMTAVAIGGSLVL
ncbi:MAG: hypothetical protein TREMPRED_004514 [Tremellales sp. Tagirdzhanova-0007]|nr:MAG: hypothetical protein TREMPRED_004514 [Tremellales sp. Tagirdzhanova-0007]